MSVRGRRGGEERGCGVEWCGSGGWDVMCCDVVVWRGREEGKEG